MVTQTQVESIIEKYQKILYLNDWLINASVVHQDILRTLIGTNNLILGSVIVEEQEHKADIYIWEGADTNQNNLSLIAIVVHEMVHIILKPFRKLFDLILTNLDNVAFKELFTLIVYSETETAVNSITRIALNYGNDSFLNTDNPQLQELRRLTELRRQKNEKKTK